MNFKSTGFRRSNLIVIFLLFLSLRGVAQCSTPQMLSAQLKTIINRPNVAAQYDSLRQWKQQWQRCRYPQDSTFTDALFQMALVQQYRGKMDSSIVVSNEVLKLFQKPKSNLRPSDLARVHYRLGALSSLTGSQEKAFFHLNQALQTGKTILSAARWVADAHVYLAFSYYSNGDYAKALSVAEAGILYAQKAKNNASMAKLFNEQAKANRALGNLPRALQTQQSAIERIKNDPTQQVALAIYYGVLGEIYGTVGNEKAAIENYRKGFLLAQKLNYYDTPDFAVRLGMAFYRQGKFKEAIPFFNYAINTYPKPIGKARALNDLGAAYWQMKHFKEAFKAYQDGLQQLPIGFTVAAIDKNPPAKSIQLIFQKEYLLTLIQDKADTWLDYYKATKTKNHLTNALKTYALADSMIDFMRYEHAGEGSKLFWRQKTRGMYERAIEASYLAGDTEAAFRFFEKSKAVLLADKLNELGANQQLSEADTRRQRSLRDSIANLQNQLATLAPNDPKRQVLQSRLERFNDDFEAFRKNLEKTNPAYYRYKYDSSTPNLTTFQQFLTSVEGGPNKVFVSYFVGDSAVYAFVVNGKNIKHHKLNLAPAAYLTTANEFLNLCANRAMLNAQYPRYRVLAHTLYEQLWKPLNINAERVVIAQDGVFLPFEAFLSQPNGNAFLLKKHAISYTYSAKFLQKSNRDLDPSYRRDDKIWARPFIGFAPENFTATLKQVPLNGSGEVLQDIGKGFWFGKKLVNAAATKANFMHYAPAARVIQLFTHADADSTDATEPKIYFQDAALRLSELNQADGFVAQLLVLSACKTGVGQNQRGEGVFSLARGFAALGISSTVTTLWNVEDQPTYALTKLFYGYLDQNQPKDLALQKAKLDWLAQGGAADALPSQWAGMILVGDASPLTLSPFGVLTIALIIPTIGGILLLLWWRKRKRTN